MEKTYRIVSYLTGLGLLCAVALVLLKTNDFTWSLWSDRDLYRAINKNVAFWFLGPEFTQGLFTPGGLYYVYLGILHWFGGDPLGVYRLLVVINLISLFFLFFELRKHVSSASAILALTIGTSQVLTNDNLNQLWNPAFGLSFACIAFALVLRWAREPKTYYLLISIVLLGTASQFHFSFLYAALLVLLVAFLGHMKMDFKRFSYGLIGFFLLYAPYVYYVSFVSPDLFGDFQKLSEYKSFNPRSDLGLAESFINLYNLNFFPIPFYTIYDGSVIDRASIKASDLIDLVSYDFAINAFSLIILCATAIFNFGYLIGLSAVFVDLLKNPSSPVIKRSGVICAFILVSVSLILVAHTLGSGLLKQRYLLWTIPLFIFVHAKVFDTLFILIYRNKLNWFRGGCSLAVNLTLIFYSLFALYSAFKYNPTDDVVGPSYSNTAAIAKILSEEIGLPPSDWGNRVAGFYFSTSKMVLVQGEEAKYRPFGYYFSAEYFSNFSSYELAKHDLSEGQCVLVFENKPNQFGPASLNDIRAALVAAGYNQKLLNLKKIHIGEKFGVFRFKPNDLSCPRNLRNNYVLLDEEKQIKHAFSQMNNGDAKISMNNSSQTNKEIDVIFKVGRDTEIGILLELTYNTDEKTVVLNSRELRSFDGTKSFDFLNPSLIFRSLDTDVFHQVPIYRGRFGSSYLSRLLASTPWRISLNTVPPGRYSIHFIADDFREFSEENWTGNVEILIMENIDLKR